MVKKILLTLLTSIASLSSSAAWAEERATKEEALALVKRAQAYIKANGKEKALAEFNNPKGMFVDRDLYIAALDMNGKVLAHGGNQRLVNKDLIDMKDADGKPFVREEIEVVKTKGSGWVDFKFVNPVTKEIEARSYYAESMGDYYIGAGVFRK